MDSIIPMSPNRTLAIINSLEFIVRNEIRVKIPVMGSI